MTRFRHTVRAYKADSEGVRPDILNRLPQLPVYSDGKKLARGDVTATGAQPCVGFITLKEYLAALEGLDIQWRMDGATIIHNKTNPVSHFVSHFKVMEGRSH